VGEIRIAQAGVETAYSEDALALRVSQAGVETAYRENNLTLRIAQVGIEGAYLINAPSFQTITAVAMSVAQLEVSTDGVTWTSIGGSTQTLDAAEQARKAGEVYTASGDVGIVKPGKREPLELVFQIVYTQTTGEAYQRARVRLEAVGGADLYVRWSPQGGSAGHERLTSAVGLLKALVYPPFNTKRGGPVMCGFTLLTSAVTTAAIT